MVATHTSLLPFSQPPLVARKCDVLLALQQPLLSLGQFYDAGFTATLNSEKFLQTKNGSTTLSWKIDHNNVLYFIPLPGYPNETPSPLRTTFQPDMEALTSASHTHPQAYIFANCAYHMNTLPALCRNCTRAGSMFMWYALLAKM